MRRLVRRLLLVYGLALARATPSAPAAVDGRRSRLLVAYVAGRDRISQVRASTVHQLWSNVQLETARWSLRCLFVVGNLTGDAVRQGFAYRSDPVRAATAPATPALSVPDAQHAMRPSRRAASGRADAQVVISPVPCAARCAQICPELTVAASDAYLDLGYKVKAMLSWISAHMQAYDYLLKTDVDPRAAHGAQLPVQSVRRAPLQPLPRVRARWTRSSASRW